MRPRGISKWWGRRAGTSATAVSTTVVFFLSFEYSWPLLLLCKGHQGGVLPSDIALFLLWGWPFLLPALSSPWPAPSIPPLLSAQRFLIRKSSLPPLTSCLKSHLHPCVSLILLGVLLTPWKKDWHRLKGALCLSSLSICFTAPSLSDSTPAVLGDFQSPLLFRFLDSSTWPTHSCRVSSSLFPLKTSSISYWSLFWGPYWSLSALPLAFRQAAVLPLLTNEQSSFLFPSHCHPPLFCLQHPWSHCLVSTPQILPSLPTTSLVPSGLNFKYFLPTKTVFCCLGGFFALMKNGLYFV